MSLWTPDGEVPVEPDQQPEAPEMSPEEAEQAREMAKAMAESRQQILETGVRALLANHAMGMYELAAIHLTAEEPDFAETRLAIDALKLFVEGLQGRLGEVEETLVEALHQIQMGYVQRYNDAKNAAAAEGPPPT
jgi:uncharacterized protein with GYD domain